MEKIFHWADYFVFGLSLALSAGIGVFYFIKGRLNETPDEFLVGKREMHWFPVSMSILASVMNAVFVIGVPAEVYYQGVMFAVSGLSLILVAPVITHVILPVFHKMEITSAYEIMFLAVVLYVPAFAFSKVTGLKLEATILATGLICTFYTALGGIKAVIWTDTLQMGIMVIGILLLAIIGGLKTGTPSEIWRTAYDAGRLDLNMFSFHPHTRLSWWTQIVGQGVTWMSVFCSNQMVLQRFFCIKRLGKAQLCVYVGSIFANILLLLVVVVGLIMYAYYRHCDPLFMQPGKGISRPDEIVPYFLMDTLGHLRGLPGLFCAGVFAASLSYVSSAVNSLSAVFLEDFIRPAYSVIKQGRTLPDRQATWISRGLAVFFGLLTLVLSFAAEKMGPVLVQLPTTIWGAVNGPMLGLFIMAFFFPCTNAWGAFTGILTGLAFNLWLAVGGALYPVPLTARQPLGIQCENLTIPPQRLFIHSSLEDFYSVSFNWYGLSGSLVCILVGVVTSFIIMLVSKPSDNDPKLMYPVKIKCCYCPKHILRFGLGHWWNNITTNPENEHSRDMKNHHMRWTNSMYDVTTSPQGGVVNGNCYPVNRANGCISNREAALKVDMICTQV